VVGIVRLYIDPRPEMPEEHIPAGFQPVVDVIPEEAGQMRKHLRRQGYEVIAVPL
jgi:hypothetical protein